GAGARVDQQRRQRVRGRVHHLGREEDIRNVQGERRRDRGRSHRARLRNRLRDPRPVRQPHPDRAARAHLAPARPQGGGPKMITSLRVTTTRATKVNTTAALLACGAVAGPLFLVVVFIQAITRRGFSMTIHPPRMLRLRAPLLVLRDRGWRYGTLLRLCDERAESRQPDSALARAGSRLDLDLDHPGATARAGEPRMRFRAKVLLAGKTATGVE